MAALSHILVAEDEESDAMLMSMAFRQAGVRNQVVIVCDGREAVDYLSGAPPYHDRATHPLPDLLLLDLKMPRMTGFDVLQWLEAHSEFNGLPAIVISSSSDVSDMERARDLGAADYLLKPTRFADLVTTVKELQQNWLSFVPTPS